VDEPDTAAVTGIAGCRAGSLRGRLPLIGGGICDMFPEGGLRMRTSFAVLALILIALPVSAQPVKFVESQRELGPIVVSELAIRDGKLVFRTESGGCTDAGSFTVDIVKEEGISTKVPHYRLTIRRVRIDECKAFLVDGVLIELDLEKDLGLKGTYTISVENPVYRRPAGTS
jgi:hypothetical protein